MTVRKHVQYQDPDSEETIITFSFTHVRFVLCNVKKSAVKKGLFPELSSCVSV